MDFLTTPEFALLIALIALAAALYSAVGHGGASGYLAAMALLGVAPAAMKPAALVMNIAVAALVFVRLRGAGYFNARLFWSFAAGSIPLAFVGGMLTLPGTHYKLLVGAALLIAAGRLLWKTEDHEVRTQPPLGFALASGAVLGLLSGLTGVGGGIFLSPLLLMLRWANMRTTAGVAAAFILVNSIAGLAGLATTTAVWSADLLWLVLAALVGAVAGSELAVRRAAPTVLKRTLGVVLAIAATKMIATA